MCGSSHAVIQVTYTTPPFLERGTDISIIVISRAPD